MASSHDLLNKITDLAAFEKQLWNSFRAAEVQSHIGVLDMRKQFKIRKELPGTTRWATRNHPIFLVAAFTSALATPFLPGFWYALGLTFYSLALAAALVSSDKFRAAHAMKVLGVTNVTDRAFGLDNLSLSVFNILSGGIALTAAKKKDIASVIKIVKSSHEYLSTNYGYHDHLKKFIVGGIVALPVTVVLLAYHNWATLPGDLQATKQFALSYGLMAPGPIAILFLLGTAISILVYSLAFGDQRLERQKKRYLLMLNVVHESWQ